LLGTSSKPATPSTRGSAAIASSSSTPPIARPAVAAPSAIAPSTDRWPQPMTIELAAAINSGEAPAGSTHSEGMPAPPTTVWPGPAIQLKPWACACSALSSTRLPLPSRASP
jgi:hypothetical protein